MRVLAGVDRPQAGVRLEGHRVVLDYFAQDQAAILNPARSVYEEMSAASPTTMVPMIRTILGGFLFSGDDVLKRVAVLSGGERNRLALAKMLLNPSNLMLLDEPTNHLDLDSKEVLLEALEDYGGTLIFVSHDRYFVDKLATRVIDVGGGEILVYPGGYEDFVDWRKRREAGLVAPLPTPAPALPEPDAPPHRPRVAKARPGTPAPARAAQAMATRAAQPAARDPLAPRLRRPDAPPDRQLREREARRLARQIAELEKRIAEKEQAVRDLEQLMASPQLYGDRAQAEKAACDHKELTTEVARLMVEWESLQTAPGESG
jgi:ATP-binding cassette subfamily F protein 3